MEFRYETKLNSRFLYRGSMLTGHECAVYKEFVDDYQRYLYSLLASYLVRTRIVGGMRILDLGTGPGYLAQELLQRSEVTVVGADINPAMLALAESTLQAVARPRWELRIADVHSLPFADGSFEMVVSYSCFHHWAEPLRALRECHRILVPGGQLVLWDTMPSRAETLTLLRTMIAKPEHYRFAEEAFAESISIDAVRALAEAAGLGEFLVRPFTFDDEDLVNCLSELPADLPEVGEHSSETTLWILESTKQSPRSEREGA